MVRSMPGRKEERRGRPALQVGAVPYRLAADGSIELLLVTSRRTGRWILPKGWPMRGRTRQEAAAIEAYEEAGIRGAISTPELGRYTYRKYRFLLRSLRCEVIAFPLLVDEELEDWPERGQRRREWRPLKAAAVALRSKEIAHLLRALPAYVEASSGQPLSTGTDGQGQVVDPEQ